jgi:C-terminal processing protease CtpA/Prc
MDRAGMMKRLLLCSGVIALLLLAPGASRLVAADKPFGGIGAQVVPTATGELVVLLVVEGTPAWRDGLRPGDLIVRVNDFGLLGSDFTEVVRKYLWGEVGSSITLHYLRPGKEGIHSITLRRVPIDTQGVQTPGVKMIVPDGRQEGR